MLRCREHAREAVRTIGLDVRAYRERLVAGAPSFAKVFDGRTPYPAQQAMRDETLGQVVLLEAETGSGKTEAALWRFLHLFERGQVDSLYLALPTRVAATQAEKRVREAIARTWPGAAPPVVRALPGYAPADGATAVRLPDFRVLWSDDPEDARAGERWAAEAPKRFLAATVAVGTIDQALLGVLQVRHAHLRHALTARSLLVIDEVHASDAYMGVLIERLINAHTALGGHVLLLSATLGARARTRYLSVKPSAAVVPELAAAVAAPYPAISDASGLRATRGATREKHVTCQCADCIDDPVRIAALAIAAAATGAKVLVIRNTVPDAVATFAALPDRSWLFAAQGVVTLHHSRFSREDRPVLDAAIEAQLGTIRPPGPLIIVGTQTLEQSLDIDADYLITDLCPMDVLLQRIGRLHRHLRAVSERPAAFREARVTVLTPPGGDLAPHLARPKHGLGRLPTGGGVYPDLRMLEATRRLIVAEASVRIPADNRRLVVKTGTHRRAPVSPHWVPHLASVPAGAGNGAPAARGHRCQRAPAPAAERIRNSHDSCKHDLTSVD
jgi:CRISPR-associated endonuclease/helicase Cas3